MGKPVVSGGPIDSKVILVGQAPGDKEPKMGRPFAWTAGRTLFKWFEQACGLNETQFRASIYMAAVCRCFPGKKTGGGDRVPDDDEIRNCSRWLEDEFEILQPDLVIPVGKLAIGRFLPPAKLDEMIGQSFRVTKNRRTVDIVPLPHPSGASPWHRMEPGRTLLAQAMRKIADHPAFRASAATGSQR
jgi:uracil-DNA glycosylase